MKLIIFCITILLLSIGAQASTCLSFDSDRLSESFKYTIKKSMNLGSASRAIYNSDKSILGVSNGYYQEKNRVAIFQVKSGNLKKLTEFKTSAWWGYHCLAINDYEVEISAHDSRLNKKRRSESFNIRPYMPQFIEEMREGLAASQNSISALNAFIAKYEPDSVLQETKLLLNEAKKQRDSLTETRYDNEFEVARKINTISSLHSYMKEYPKTTRKKEAVKAIYDLVNLEGNIIGYKWFLDNYPNSKQSRDALKSLHKRAFEIADDIGTIDSYNDFVIAYPVAEQVIKANEKAYALERKTYSSYFTSNEKLSRALLVRSKQLERKAREVNSDQRTGYMLVVNRMNELLQDEFPAEEATLRYLESEEFKSFYKDFKRILTRIDRKLEDIRSNTANLSSLIKDQTRLMDNHFEKAAESREMSAELTKQHRYWERYLKK